MVKTVFALPKRTSQKSTDDASLACQNSQHLTTFTPACRSRLLSLTNSSPVLFSCRAGSWPVSWLSSATRAPSWAGRNLRRRKQLHRLQRLRRATLSTTGPSQCELNYRQPTLITEISQDRLDKLVETRCYAIRRPVLYSENQMELCGQWNLELFRPM